MNLFVAISTGIYCQSFDSPGSAQGWTSWLEPAGTALFAVLMVIACVIAWGTNLIALPGNWISVGLLAFYFWVGPQEGRAAIGGVALISAFVLALTGEIVEFVASAFGAQKAGASRRSTLYAVIGSMAGAVIGAVVGLPVPAIGSLLAAVLFGGIGASAGAMYGEWSDGKPWKENWSVGHAAFWGRTAGTLGKVSVGFAIVLIALASVLL